MVSDRYSSWSSELGQKVEAGNCSLEELEAFAKTNGEPTQKSGEQELFEMTLNHYV